MKMIEMITIIEGVEFCATFEADGVSSSVKVSVFCLLHPALQLSRKHLLRKHHPII